MVSGQGLQVMRVRGGDHGAADPDRGGDHDGIDRRAPPSDTAKQAGQADDPRGERNDVGGPAR